MLKHNGKEIAGKTVLVSGSGNVAIYAVEKAQQYGAKVVAMSDSNGYIYDADGIKLDVVMRSRKYAEDVSKSTQMLFLPLFIQKARASGPFLAISHFHAQPRTS